MGRKIEVVFRQVDNFPDDFRFDYWLEEYTDDRFVIKLERQRGGKIDCNWYDRQYQRRHGDIYKRRRWNREQVIY